mgnify:CR=1 FL=1
MKQAKHLGEKSVLKVKRNKMLECGKLRNGLYNVHGGMYNKISSTRKVIYPYDQNTIYKI